MNNNTPPLTVEPSNIVEDNMNNHIDEAMKQFPKAKRLAVENFCWTAPNAPTDNYWNLVSDAQSYKWNADTVEAIRYVLRQDNKI